MENGLLKLITQLALAVATNEIKQERFRTAVLIRLANIETILTMIQGAQIAEMQAAKPGSEEKTRTMAKEVEEIVSEQSKELLLKMVKYIYEGPEAPRARRNKRRQ